MHLGMLRWKSVSLGPLSPPASAICMSLPCGTKCHTHPEDRSNSRGIYTDIPSDQKDSKWEKSRQSDNLLEEQDNGIRSTWGCEAEVTGSAGALHTHPQGEQLLWPWC